MKIYKYPLDLRCDTTTIEMPKNSKILHLDNQEIAEFPFDRISIWAMGDESRATEKRMFKVYATGEEIEFRDEKNYVGTVKQRDLYMWHIFEII